MEEKLIPPQKSSRKCKLLSWTYAFLGVFFIVGITVFCILMLFDLEHKNTTDKNKTTLVTPALSAATFDSLTTLSPRSAVKNCTASLASSVVSSSNGSSFLALYTYDGTSLFPLSDKGETSFSIACLRHTIIVWAEQENSIFLYALHSKNGQLTMDTIGSVLDYPVLLTEDYESSIRTTYNDKSERIYRYSEPFPQTIAPNIATALPWPSYIRYNTLLKKEEDTRIPVTSILSCTDSMTKKKFTTTTFSTGLNESFLHLNTDNSETALLFTPDDALCYAGEALFYGYYKNAPILAIIANDDANQPATDKDELNLSVVEVDPLSINCPPYGLPLLLPANHDLQCNDIVTDFDLPQSNIHKVFSRYGRIKRILH